MVVGLAALAFMVFLPVLRAGYIWDDNAVHENPLLRTPAGLVEIWTQPSLMDDFESHYWPLVYTSFWIEYRLHGENPFGHHLVNLLLHAVNVVLLWQLLRRIGVPGAWLGAALFAVHPVHVESVAWIIERKDVLSMFFYLLAFLAFVRFEARGSRLAYGGALALFACAMLSKSITISLPFALLLWMWWKQERVTKRQWIQVAPFFAVAVALGALDVLLARSTEPVSLPLTMFDRMLLAGRVLWFYAGKLVWPFDLMALYPRWEISTGDAVSYLFPLGVAAVLAGLWLGRRKVGRGPLAAVLFFCITLGPVLGFILFSFMTYSYVADRFQYLASAGLLALAGAGAVRAAEHLGRRGGAVLGVAAAFVVVGLGVLTWRQARVYENLETFWAYNYEKNPTHVASSALGDVYLRRGEIERAAELQEVSLDVRDNARARFRLGETYLKHKDYDRALEEFLHARRINQGTNKIEALEPGLCFNIGMIYWRKAEWENCREYWALALEANPDMAEAQEWLPKVEARIQRMQESESKEAGQAPGTETPGTE
jgi:tetratricopeptide (TPR) repeat protein